jgi:hypothetical protein
MVQQCVFCPTGSAETRDHVPPRSFFPEQLSPSVQLITVPCCKSCHRVSQRTDALVRNLFISVREVESSKDVKQGLAARRDRSFERKQSEFLRLLRLVQRVEVTTPAGIFLRNDFAFNFDVPVVHNFVERACRAVLWKEFRLPYFASTFPWRMNVDLGDLIYTGLAKFGRVRKVHDAFAYGVTRPNEDGPGWVILNFYGSLEIFAQVNFRATKESHE